MEARLQIVEIRGKDSHQSFCAAVDEGLSAPEKWLPTRFLYDRTGSELFEQITELPEYYLTRCETEIFERYADEIMATARAASLVEFGSGSSKKTRLLIESGLRQGHLSEYVPIDISIEFLRETSERLLEDYRGLAIQALAAEYFDAAEQLPSSREARFVLFLGSNIGNLTRGEAVDFLSRLSRQLDPEDRVLVGVDLVKDPAVIESAYNDAAGVTAAFNKNLLKRLNRELDASFDLAAFRHQAPYLPADQRVEMRLYSERDQDVYIDAIGKSFHFDAGEFIHTEWSHKYTLESFAALAADAKLEIQETWHDGRGWFAAVMLRGAR